MHVLIATDGSPSSIDAARAAAELLRSADQVTLLSVVTEVPGDDAGGFEGSVYSPGEQDELWKQEMAEAGEELERTAAALTNAKIDKRIEVGDVGGNGVPGRRRAARRRDRRGFARPRRDRAAPARFGERAGRAARAVPRARGASRAGDVEIARRRDSSSPARAVALPVRVLGERRTAGRPERSGRMADRDERDRPHVLGQAEDRLHLGAEAGGDRRRARCRARARSPRAAGSAPPGRSTTGSSLRGRAARRRTRRCSRARRRRRRSRPDRRRPASAGVSRVPRTRVRALPTRAAKDRRSRPGSRRRARRRTPTAACSRRSARTSPRSRTRAIVSSSTASVAERPARALARDDGEEVVAHGHGVARADADERVDVHDAQARSPGPALERVGVLVADALASRAASSTLNAVSGSSVSIS